jgi:hypothetical protein
VPDDDGLQVDLDHRAGMDSATTWTGVLAGGSGWR